MSTMYNIKSYYRTLPYMIRRRLLDMIYVGKGLVKKYRGGGGWAGAERGWVMRF